MHTAPGGSRKLIFVNQDRYKIYTFGLISTLCVLAGNIMFLYHTPGVWAFGLFVFVTAFYLGLSYLVGFAGKSFDFARHQELVAKWFDKSEDANVDIYLPICGEPTDIILNTWQSVREMIRFHPNVNVYVLDDKPTPTAYQTARDMGFNYMSRLGNELKKAGNLRNAFGKTSGEFILILDADFCPRKDFLLETMPYMLEDENVAIVQTPQFFDHYVFQGWIANAAGAVQELFYRLIQVNRDTFGGAICVGTNALYRRKALEPFGGTAPMAYSEDVHTGFQCLTSGWAIKYIPVIVAEGVCPDSMQQFFTQQYRWAMGSISLFFSKKFWAAPITKMQRICYLTGMLFYMSTGLGVLIVPLPSIIMLAFFPDKIHWYNLLFSVPSLVFGTLFMKHWMKLPMTMDVLTIRHVSYYAHLYALRDYLLGTLEEWKPTGAKSSSARYQSFTVFFMVWTTVITSAIVFGTALRIAEGHNPLNFVLLIAFLIFNMRIVLPVFTNLWGKDD